jgi:hypothetical protein
MKWIAVVCIALVGLLGLAACQGNVASVSLPLAQDKPTFLYFYTDN